MKYDYDPNDQDLVGLIVETPALQKDLDALRQALTDQIQVLKANINQQLTELEDRIATIEDALDRSR